MKREQLRQQVASLLESGKLEYSQDYFAEASKIEMLLAKTLLYVLDELEADEDYQCEQSEYE